MLKASTLNLVAKISQNGETEYITNLIEPERVSEDDGHILDFE